jgi:2-hydroxychromene-2-carboxylate isomerase
LVPAAAFYFDLASPECYLAAERILQLLPGAAEWTPVLAAGLPGSEQPPAPRAEIPRRAQELGLQPLRWPEPFPFDSALAMRVATYAKSIGRAVPFAQAAFRQAFAGGHSLAEADHVLIAAAACEMHPAAVLRGAELRSVERELATATDRAARAGIIDVPAVVVDGAQHGAAAQVFLGADAIERAAVAMSDSAALGPR